MGKEELAIPPSLSDIEQTIQNRWAQTPDLVVCRLYSQQLNRNVLLIYLDSLIDKNSINNNVLQPLLFERTDAHNVGDLALLIGQKKHATLWSDVEEAIFQGESVLFVEGQAEAIILDTQGWPQRAIAEPQVESSLKGSHQGFIETGEKNIALIRRYLPNRELKIKELTVGRRGKTKVALLYLEDVTSKEVLQELEGRIRQVDIDAIVNTGELMQLIEDNPFSPFPQFLLTERPDAAVSHLLQGRIVVVVDRSPSVMIGPMSFVAFFQTVDDYSTRWMIASFLRLLRMLAFFCGHFFTVVIYYNDFVSL